MRLEITEAMRGLRKYLALVAEGESILLCDHDRPVAEIRPVSRPVARPRPIGLAKGKLTVSPEFFEPLPDDLLDAFESRG